MLDKIVSVASENNALAGDADCTSPISLLVLAELLADAGVLEIFVFKSENPELTIQELKAVS